MFGRRHQLETLMSGRLQLLLNTSESLCIFCFMVSFSFLDNDIIYHVTVVDVILRLIFGNFFDSIIGNSFNIFFPIVSVKL